MTTPQHRSTCLRIAAATFGALVLTTVGAAAAIAADSAGDDSDVDVNVSISELTEPGVLAMSVAGTTTTLTESDSGDPLVREFSGQLPTVTVTDTRTADDIPDGAAWYVLGTAGDFVGSAGQQPIGAGHLGWVPRLIDGGDSGLVSEGPEVATVVDDHAAPDNVGLIDQELLANTWSSGDVAAEGSWTVTADLFLRTEKSVAAGDYSSTLTLSLFE
ncbi:MAG TPA: hypothetical protein VEP72_03460 [Microbacterium sp.]|nr:hypothetical protein [Microbacterium sp.]